MASDNWSDCVFVQYCAISNELLLYYAAVQVESRFFQRVILESLGVLIYSSLCAYISITTCMRVQVLIFSLDRLVSQFPISS